MLTTDTNISFAENAMTKYCYITSIFNVIYSKKIQVNIGIPNIYRYLKFPADVKIYRR